MTDFGVLIFATDYSIQPAVLGRVLEQRGFESLFLPEHTHIPVSRQTPWPGGAELPREYSHTHDPFVALSAVASVTSATAAPSHRARDVGSPFSAAAAT